MDKNKENPRKTKKRTQKITVSGVTFSSDQVKSVVLHIDGRDIHITETKEEVKKIGF